jgi:hypothetical protein
MHLSNALLVSSTLIASISALSFPRRAAQNPDEGDPAFSGSAPDTRALLPTIAPFPFPRNSSAVLGTGTGTGTGFPRPTGYTSITSNKTTTHRDTSTLTRTNIDNINFIPTDILPISMPTSVPYKILAASAKSNGGQGQGDCSAASTVTATSVSVLTVTVTADGQATGKPPKVDPTGRYWGGNGTHSDGGSASPSGTGKLPIPYDTEASISAAPTGVPKPKTTPSEDTVTSTETDGPLMRGKHEV